MEFESLDEELEELIQKIINRTDECSGCASGIEFYNSEYRELKELGYFEVVSEYIDGTALIRSKRKMLKYFDRKKEWEKQKRLGTVKDIDEKVVDKGADIAATIVTKMAGM